MAPQITRLYDTRPYVTHPGETAARYRNRNKKKLRLARNAMRRQVLRDKDQRGNELDRIDDLYPSMISAYLSWLYLRILPCGLLPGGFLKAEVILDEQSLTGTPDRQCLVKWKDYPLQLSSWIPVQDSRLSPEFIQHCRTMRMIVRSCESNLRGRAWTNDQKPKVHGHLLSFLAEKFQLANWDADCDTVIPLHVRELRLLMQEMVQKDNLTSIVMSAEYSERLTIMANYLPGGRRAHTIPIHTAALKDQEDIRKLVRCLLDDVHEAAIMSLSRGDAEKFITAVQMCMNNSSWLLDTNIQKVAHRRITALYLELEIIPRSLIIHGVSYRKPFLPTELGGCANIFVGEYQGKMVALKSLRMPHKNRRYFCREVLVWKKLNHKYIHQMLGVDAEIEQGDYLMVTPWVPYGTINRYLREYHFQAVEVPNFIRQTAEGIQFLHENEVVHGDLRGVMDNILVSDSDHVLITDFGLGRFENSKPEQTYKRGSTRWMAPELLNVNVAFERTTASDVYAFACVCLELYTLKSPFPDIPERLEGLVVNKVLRGERSPRSPEIDERTWTIMRWCWYQNRDARPTMSTVFSELKEESQTLLAPPSDLES